MRHSERLSDARRRKALALIASALLLSMFPSRRAVTQPSQPDARFDIVTQIQRFAIPDCVPRGGDDAVRDACNTMTTVLRRDLRFEGIFQFVPDNLLTAIPAMNPDAPNLDDWKSIAAQILVISRAEIKGKDLALEVKLHYVPTGQVILSRRYAGKEGNPRALAHQAADDIMKQVQFQGVSRTKIVFASDRDSSKGHPTKELYIVDYDGFNPRRLTVNRSLNILPNWRPDGRAISYVSYRQGIPGLFLAAIYEGRSQTITGDGYRSAQVFAPSFSPDGSRVAFASNRKSNMDIWVANADGSGARQITSSPAIDTAPCWSPTGQEIAFTSDRGGTPQIWIMDDEGLNVRRLTNVGNYNDAPNWNPSKQHPEIAYTSRLEGRFEIAVVDLGTSQVRQITAGRGSCESPSWAPNGRHLVFSCRRGRRWSLTIADRTGARVETLDVGPGNSYQPDWGPVPAR
ncbi:MAG: PD40 domain-containing protein [Vicinamibacteria bacterium]|nr:PD40 domain-containing protein [Vicinamibacteria bacterium]